jgi:anti-sigma factor RsiW
MSPDDRVHEYDINAYIDGEVDDETARAVQLYLAEHPEEAAAVMADMAIVQGLRAAARNPEKPSIEVRESAARLQGSLRAPSYRRRFTAAAVLTAAYLGGWLTAGAIQFNRQDLFPFAPAFVDEAMMSHRTALLRARMDSQPEVTTIDRNEISRATKISLPPIPVSWRLTDAQVYPSDEGPSVGLSFRTPSGPISLFAFHTQDAASIHPTIVRRDSDYVSYWQVGGLAFALIGPSDPSELRRIAVELAQTTRPARAL